ncbi:CotY/CotZ family spore coat protein [Gottfriedia luciferensis]|uniref:CotY/CotZ family spore coat protein n=1 Tax=Gottfriedia luciferensis TaxID=178774 RepID=UPI000B449F79|nr:CotY/CotZ family spore coat protein [Gottfriedia luciferensis]
MSCKDDHNRKRNHCVCDVVKFINDLQDCATHTCPTGCDVPFLGANPNVPLANTRPFLLYLANGELFRVPAFNNTMTAIMAQQRDGGDGQNQNQNKNAQINNCQDTVVFRVESVDDDCCAVLRALVPVKTNNQGGNKDKDQNQINFCNLVDGDMFVASNTCVTVDLDCFCAIQCLRDVHVSNL